MSLVGLLPVEVQDAADAAEVVYVLSGIEPSRYYEAALLNGTRLVDIVSPETRRAFAAAAAFDGIPEEEAFADFNEMKPWYAAITLGTMAAVLNGVDMTAFEYLQNEASRGGKDVRAMLTDDESIEILDGMPLEMQDWCLRAAVTDWDKLPAAMSRTAAAWRAGDDAVLLAEMMAGFADAPSGLLDRLVYDVNAVVAERLRNDMTLPARSLLVVEVGRTLGSKGIPALLAPHCAVRRVTITNADPAHPSSFPSSRPGGQACCAEKPSGSRR